jgi:hypothetical protein
MIIPHARVDIPRGLLPSVFRLKVLYECVIFHMGATYKLLFICLDFVTRISQFPEHTS